MCEQHKAAIVSVEVTTNKLKSELAEARKQLQQQQEENAQIRGECNAAVAELIAEKEENRRLRVEYVIPAIEERTRKVKQQLSVIKQHKQQEQKQQRQQKRI